MLGSISYLNMLYDILDALSHVDETAYFNCVSKGRSINHECKVTYTHIGMQFYCSMWQYAMMSISFLCKILRPLKRVSMILICPH